MYNNLKKDLNLLNCASSIRLKNLYEQCFTHRNQTICTLYIHPKKGFLTFLENGETLRGTFHVWQGTAPELEHEINKYVTELNKD
jgi:hypothetical protein